MAYILTCVVLFGLVGCSSSRERTRSPREPERTLPEPIDANKNRAPPEEDMSFDMSDLPAVTHSPDAPLNHKSIAFEDACSPGPRVTIAAVGDVLLHTRLQRQATSREDRFRSLWRPLEDLIRGADIAYANLEGPAAYGVLQGGEVTEDPGFRFDGDVYSTWPRFNYHPYLVEDLVEAGFDVVSTANNHSLDRAGIGVDRTIEALDRVGLAYTGTRRSDWKLKSVKQAWHTITEVEGWRIAWLACTYSTNGLPDYKNQVLFCYDDRQVVLDVVEELSSDASIDAVIVTPHWGWEYREKPRNKQVKFGRELLEAGAKAVIGGHVHVLQPWERYRTESGREGFILYSTGNFVSNMAEIPERTSIMLLLGLTRKPDGEVVLNGVRHVPLWLHRDRGLRYVGDIARSAASIPAEAVWHIQRIFGSYNEHDPTIAMSETSTTPQCDPEWEAPTEAHPHNGWLGGACDEDAEGQCAAKFGEAVCDGDAPQGFCARSCDGSCPRRRGQPRTACASLAPDEREGVCMVRCKRDGECRPGYACEYRYVARSSSRRVKVCVAK